MFLDRDGVINCKAPDGEYVTSWRRFEFLPRALDGMRVLAQSDVPIVIATNQRGVALGRMSEADLEDIHRRMSAAIARAGGRIDAIYHCPHDVGCDCRKPSVGMFEQAARDLTLRLDRSAVVGDSAKDMLAAARIGALRVLIGDREPCDADFRAVDLPEAILWLLAQ